MAEDLKLERVDLLHENQSTVKVKFPYKKDRSEDDYMRMSCEKFFKKWIFLLLERPSTKIALCYHTLTLFLICTSLVIGVLSTIESIRNQLKKPMFYYEVFLLFWFSIEFIMRVWSCSFVSRYQGIRGRIRFMCSFYMMIDIFIIISTATTLIMEVNKSYFTILRVTRFMQVFRILRVDRQRGDFRTMGNVVKEHSKELITVYFVGFVIMFSATYIVYLCEKQKENVEKLPQSPNSTVTDDEIMINNMANGLYWAVITVTSVGYGDLSPITWLGKVFCAIFALVGCAFFSLPAGILGSGFALQVAKQKKEKRYVKVRNPAAYVIQTTWRNYAIKKGKDRLQASWYYLFPQLRATNSELKSLQALMKLEYSNKANVPFTSKVDGGSFSKPAQQSPNNNNTATTLNGGQQMIEGVNNAFEGVNNAFEEGFKKLGKLFTPAGKSGEPDDDITIPILRREQLLLPQYRCNNKTNESGHNKHQNAKSNVPICVQLDKKYKLVLGFIMRLRFRHAVKIFKNVRHPFVNMQDIMEKNALSHVEMLSQLKAMKESFRHIHSEIQQIKISLNRIRKEEGASAKYLHEEQPRQRKLRRSVSLCTLSDY